MPSYEYPYPRQFYVDNPAIGHDVPLPISCLPQFYHMLKKPPGFEMVEDFLSKQKTLQAKDLAKGEAFSKAARKGKVEDLLASKGVAFSKAAAARKGEDKGKGEFEGKGKDSGIPEADRASGRHRFRSRSREHFAP
jgi:hypothetical protein